MIIIEDLRKRARCGYCKKQLTGSSKPPLILLENTATWEVPTWRAQDHEPLKAVGVICDTCIVEKRTPLEAIEVSNEDNIIYHELEVGKK